MSGCCKESSYKGEQVDVALDVGYASPSHFAKLFRRETGLYLAITVGRVDLGLAAGLQKTNSFVRNSAVFCDYSRALFSLSGICGFEQYRDRLKEIGARISNQAGLPQRQKLDAFRSGMKELFLSLRRRLRQELKITRTLP